MLSDPGRGAFHDKKEWLLSVMKVQSIALKAIHDCFEERKYYQILPVLLSRLTYSTHAVRTEPPKIKYKGQNLKLNQSMTLHMQIALGMGLEKIYSISPNLRLELPNRLNYDTHTLEYNELNFEIKDANFNDTVKFTEELMRRIRVDLQTQAGPELVHFDRNFNDWEDHFPVYYSHDLEIDYDDDWRIQASLDHQTPFWVICTDEDFYDMRDPTVSGEHYLNYTLYYPEGFGKALRGSQREYRYQELIDQMETMNISRYNFTDYLILAQEEKLQPSSGASLGIERLIRYLTNQENVSDIQLFGRNPNDEVLI